MSLLVTVMERASVCFGGRDTPMAVFLMQVEERMELIDRSGGAGGAASMRCLCLGSFCNEMVCVMQVLSKQWLYSSWRGASVRTRLNTIPQILPLLQSSVCSRFSSPAEINMCESTC